MSEELGLFCGKSKPDVQTVWSFYDKGRMFNNQLNLDDTVKANENFYIGKQWEGVQANGLPTPQINIIKRVVGFITATITTDNIKVNATALANTAQTEQFLDPARIANEEFESLTEHNDVPGLLREFTRNAAVDGDGCMYTYWDPDVNLGGGVMGAIKTEILDNTRVFFGNPNDKDVQEQPYIIVASREIVRNAKLRAKKNKIADWEQIMPDSDDSNVMDSAKYTDDKVTVLLTLWRDDDSGEIWAYESTQNCEIRKPWSLGIRLYPICWLPWDDVKDCYHGQAMITGLIPNQIFINKSMAMTQLSLMRTGYPKYVFNRSLVRNWDNRVGGAIPVSGGDINNVAKAIDPPSISPQISEFITMTVELTEQSLGATSVALGDTRPDNTSAIIALQRAAATPSEMTKQRLYKAVESLYRIYLEFIGVNYGTRVVDTETPEEVRQAYAFMGQVAPDEIQVEFDFGIFKEYPMALKLDVGASSYYSEIAAMQTLDGLLTKGHITTLQYLERIPDGYIPRRRALIAELKQQMQQPQMGVTPPVAADTPAAGAQTTAVPGQALMDVPVGRGYGSLQRKINQQGSTEGLI